MISLNHRGMRRCLRIALWAAGGGLILALLAVATAFVWLKWDDWFWPREFLYTAEQQLVDLALRNPVSGRTPPSSFVAATRPAYYNCRVVSTTRNVAINPLACKWSYQSIQAYLETGPVFDLAVSGSGARNPNHLQAFHDGAGDTWDIFLGEEINESAAVRQLVASGGAVPVKRNRPILRPSADCPGLYLSSDTVNQAACVFARALVPYKIDIVIQSPPMDHYITGYLDHYNDRMWQAAREVVGSRFEVMVWSILERR